jgi:hypothetical protein
LDSALKPVVFFSQQPLLLMPKPVQPAHASQDCAQNAYVPCPAMRYWPSAGGGQSALVSTRFEYHVAGT